MPFTATVRVVIQGRECITHVMEVPNDVTAA